MFINHVRVSVNKHKQVNKFSEVRFEYWLFDL